VLSDLPTNQTMPPTRTYPFPSCPACLTIGLRRGWRIGQRSAQGTIEAFSHSKGENGKEQAFALVTTVDGFLAPVPLEELVKEG